MTDREQLAKIIHKHVWGEDYPGDEAECCADEVLKSEWLSERDAKIKAEAEAVIEELRKTMPVHRSSSRRPNAPFARYSPLSGFNQECVCGAQWVSEEPDFECPRDAILRGVSHA